ncbi:MAG: hypothetical protein WC551_09445 [Patescibacteria group bacterium]
MCVFDQLKPLENVMSSPESVKSAKSAKSPDPVKNDSPAIPAPTKPKCKVPECLKDAEICGVCQHHYSEMLRMIRAGEITREALIAAEVLLPAGGGRTSKVRAALAKKGIKLAPAVKLPKPAKKDTKTTTPDKEAAPAVTW